MGPEEAARDIALGEFSTWGDSERMLQGLLVGSGAEWWVDRGEFWIVPQGEPIEGEAIRVSEGREGGLRKEPQAEEGGAVLLASWYRGDARVGRAVEVDARVYSGLYRIDEVRHVGSNLRGDFQTLMRVRKVGLEGLLAGTLEEALA